MDIVNGKTYRFINVYHDGYGLNIYGTKDTDIKGGQNVCLYSASPTDQMQQWKAVAVSGASDVFQLEAVLNSVYVLDCSDGSISTSYKNNAHMCKKTGTSAVDSGIIAKPVQGVQGNQVRICLPEKNLYLTATTVTEDDTELSNNISTSAALRGGSTGRGNVYWASPASEGSMTWKKQCWEVIEVGGGTDPDPGETTSAPIDPPANIESVNIMQRYKAPLPFTGSNITIYNVQNDNSTEYYHRGSGFRPSENGENFLDTANGQTVLSTIQNFAKEVFAIDYLPARSSVAYYLFGEYDSKAKFHHGVDMNIGDGKKIHAFWGGKILAKGGDYGCVMIYVPELEVTTIYLHMKNIPNSLTVNQTIPAGTIIGEQSNVSRDNITSHLHFEVRPKEVYSAGNNFSSSASTALTSLIPYGYMRK